MHHPTDRIAHTTAFVTPVVEHWLEREIANYSAVKIYEICTVNHDLDYQNNFLLSNISILFHSVMLVLFLVQVSAPRLV